MEEKKMNISGSGVIKSNIYDEEINISGSGRIEGDIRCISLHASGSVSASGNVECTGGIHISGSGKFEGNVSCSDMHVSGSVFSADLTAKNDIRISGTCRTTGDIRSKEIRVSGGIYTDGAVKCDTVKISGKAECGSLDAEHFASSGQFRISGLLNVGTADIKLTRGRDVSTAGSIGGTNIRVEKGNDGVTVLFGIFNRGKHGTLTVDESIEGDDIYLENTACPLVIGKNVTVGEGCRIEKIQYSDNYVIKGDAYVAEAEII